jgi:hypothetical protein
MGMARGPPTSAASPTAAAMAADSPRASSESPPPVGIQGDLEMELVGLANALYNLGTTVVNDLTKDKDKLPNGKQIGPKVSVMFFSFLSFFLVAFGPCLLIP